MTKKWCKTTRNVAHATVHYNHGLLMSCNGAKNRAKCMLLLKTFSCWNLMPLKHVLKTYLHVFKNTTLVLMSVIYVQKNATRRFKSWTCKLSRRNDYRMKNVWTYLFAYIKAPHNTKEQHAHKRQTSHYMLVFFGAWNDTATKQHVHANHKLLNV